MNWRGFLVVCVVVLATNSIYAQANLLNAKIPEEIGMKTAEQLAADNDGPLPYGYIDDRDILWSKVVWEYIDLNEKINLPFYYPIDTNNISSSRRSLYDTLLRGIKSGEIADVYDDSYFENKLTFKEIQARLSRVDTSDAGIELLNAGEEITDEYVDRVDLTAGDIAGLKIKGVWYFDKRQGELKYRLLGIAPVAPDVNFMGMGETSMDELVELFWVWYPGAREVTHAMKVFNNKNSAFPLSYDHLLNARRFVASIYREENIYGNRDVAEYIKGNALFQVLEADRLKEDIRNKELDMWNY
ncbi:gliding motility protein GldN [Aureibaculum marinum]|uniref:Gliding motility protein GldN n=1 Tax=Aureibaculum marinum TaxID=2487930 RepID=A0A3N4P7I1_9FLAO|nr:gliding motility protein GldN [Aureibaculum marinum]RPD99649.1 gliding motility protein GldN [Aureibaculum marinum]